MLDRVSGAVGNWVRAAGALAAFSLLLAADRTAGNGRVALDGFWDACFFEAADAYQPAGYRLLGPGSEIVLEGLWAGSRLLVEMDVAAGPQKRAGIVPLSLDNAPAARMQLLPTESTWRFAAVADAKGELQVRVDGERWIRVRALRVGQHGPARVPSRRIAEYALLVLGLLGITAGRFGKGAQALASGSVSALLSAWIVADRLRALSCISWIVWPCVLALVAWWLARRISIPRAHASWIAWSVALKLLVGTHPALEQPDLVYHAHQALFLQEGRPVVGKYGVHDGREMLFIPYPPALYAVLQPLIPAVGDEQDRARAALTAVRWAMPLLEASAAFLVFAIATAGGAPAAAASAAAVTAAVMPEGLLVVLKSVAANIMGNWASLLFLALLLARRPVVLLAPAAALAFLGHPGAAVTLACLLPLWGILEGRRAGWKRPGLAMLAAMLGAGIAWFLYYKTTASLVVQATHTLANWGQSEAPAFFRLRLVHLGKLVQDLLLKFGLGPLWLAWVGLRGGNLPPRLRPLLVTWLGVAFAFALAAVLTPVSVRFEYFVSPALALAAGLGAARAESEGRRPLVRACWGLALGVQVLLGMAGLAGRLRLISLIIPSQRWPFPFAL